MPALAMGIGFLGYSIGLWGYCLDRGYNVTLWSLLSPRHPPTWASIRASQIPPGQVFPSGSPAPASSGSGSPPGPSAKPPAVGLASDTTTPRGTGRKFAQ